MGYIINSVTGERPLSVADAKSNLKVEHSDDDTLIQNMVDGAVLRLEGHLGYWIQERTITEYFKEFDDPLELRFPLISAVSSVKYYDDDNTIQTLSTSIYELDASVEPNAIIKKYDQDWPTIVTKSKAIEVAYTTGYNLAASVPEDIINALQLMVADLYQYRHDRAWRFPNISKYYIAHKRIWMF